MQHTFWHLQQVNSTCRSSSKSSARYIARERKKDTPFWAQNNKALEFTFADPGDKGSNVCSDLLATRRFWLQALELSCVAVVYHSWTCASHLLHICFTIHNRSDQRNPAFWKDVAACGPVIRSRASAALETTPTSWAAAWQIMAHWGR